MRKVSPFRGLGGASGVGEGKSALVLYRRVAFLAVCFKKSAWLIPVLLPGLAEAWGSFVPTTACQSSVTVLAQVRSASRRATLAAESVSAPAWWWFLRSTCR